MRPSEWVVDLALSDDAQRGIFGDGYLRCPHPAIGAAEFFTILAGQGSKWSQTAVEMERHLTVVEATRSKRN